MPKRKTGGNRSREFKEAKERADRIAPKLADAIILSGTAPRSLSRTHLIEAISKIITDPHIAGIRKTNPEISYEGYEKGKAIFKVSISTTHTRKEFIIRK